MSGRFNPFMQAVVAAGRRCLFLPNTIHSHRTSNVVPESYRNQLSFTLRLLSRTKHWLKSFTPRILLLRRSSIMQTVEVRVVT